MAWYPGAAKIELQPESDAQPAIVPTQFIVHSIAAPWTVQRIFEYWRDSTNLESHFGLGYDGSLGQFVGTQTRADANYRANLRPDGTGAVSLESASNLEHTDPWTDPQIETLIRLGVWLHQQHNIPLRVCRTASDPGYGYHRLHADWAISGTACPGDARVRQFNDVVFPGIVARATGQQEDDMATPQEIANAVWSHEEKPGTGNPVRTGAAITWMDSVHASQNTRLDALAKQVTDLAAAVASLTTTGLTPAQITAIANAVADVQAKRLES